MPCLVVLAVMVVALVPQALAMANNGQSELVSQAAPAASGSCPAWLKEYKEFHAQQRTSEDATYILYEGKNCMPGQPCASLAQRVHGIMFSLRLAAQHKKVLIIDWDQPAPLTQFITPAQIDWSIDGVDLPNIREAGQASAFNLEVATKQDILDKLKTPEGAQSFASAKVVLSTTALHPGTLLGTSADKEIGQGDAAITYFRCLFEFLFTLKPAIVQEADRSLNTLYNNKVKPYAAWHWRRSADHHQRPSRYGHAHVNSTAMQDLMSILDCFDAVTKESGLKEASDKPMLLSTHHNLIRQWVAAGEVTKALSTNMTMVHSTAPNFSMQDFMAAWIDLRMLSNADCLFFGNSAFSEVALWMRGSASTNKCVMHTNACLLRDKAKFDAVPVRRRRI